MRKIALVIISFVLFTTAASAQKQVLDKIVAVVGPHIILKSDLDLQSSFVLCLSFPLHFSLRSLSVLCDTYCFFSRKARKGIAKEAWQSYLNNRTFVPVKQSARSILSGNLDLLNH